MNIALNMKRLYERAEQLDAVLVCLPHTRVYSAAHRRVAPLLELPVKVMQQSVASTS